MKQKKTWLAVLYSLRCLQNSMADAKFKLNIDGDAIRKRYSDKKKKARMMLKSEIVKDCDPFVPMLEGALKNSPIASISKDDDFIIYLSPYAHYQYYGVLYVDPMTGKGAFFDPEYGFWSRPGVSKKKSGRSLNYSTTHHPKACSRWFEKGKNIHGKQWIDAAKKIYKE